MSGLVTVRYTRLPTSWRYNVASAKGDPSVGKNLALTSRGDEAILLSVNPTRERGSLAYLACDREYPFQLEATSKPKK